MKFTQPTYANLTRPSVIVIAMQKTILLSVLATTMLAALARFGVWFDASTALTHIVIGLTRCAAGLRVFSPRRALAVNHPRSVLSDRNYCP